MLHHHRYLGCVLGAAFLMTSPQARGLTIRADQPDADYQTLAMDFPAVGAWLAGGFKCSATVVNVTGSTGYAVTAASCSVGLLGELRLGDDLNAPVSAHPVTDVSTHPDFDGSADHNLAVLRFSNANASTPIADIYTGSDQYGQAGTIVGFGTTGTGLTGGVTSTSLKRGGTNEIDGVGLSLFMDFDEPGNPGASTMGSPLPLGLEGIPCFGDTGGGVFADFGSGQELIGTVATVWDTSGGALCDYGDTLLSVTLVENFDFLNDAIYSGAPGLVRVPEPSSPTLLGSGVFVLWFLARGADCKSSRYFGGDSRFKRDYLDCR